MTTRWISALKLLLLTNLAVSVSLAQDTLNHSTSPNQLPKKNGIEFSLFGAASGFYKLNYTRTVGINNARPRQIVVGVSTVPGDQRAAEGRFTDASLWIGYRHFIWKGLHAEVGMVHSYARVSNNPEAPARTFSSYGFSNYRLLGYQFQFARAKPVSYYLNVQPVGFFYQWVETDRWPGQGDNRSFFLGLDADIKF